MPEPNNADWGIDVEISNSILRTMAHMASAPKSQPERFWHIVSHLAAGTRKRHARADEPVLISIGNEHYSADIFLKATVNQSNGICTYELFNGLPEARKCIVSFDTANWTPIVGQRYEQAETVEGRPIPFPRELLNLLKEIRAFIEASLNLATKDRYKGILKDRLDAFIAQLR